MTMRSNPRAGAFRSIITAAFVTFGLSTPAANAQDSEIIVTAPERVQDISAPLPTGTDVVRSVTSDAQNIDRLGSSDIFVPATAAPLGLSFDATGISGRYTAYNSGDWYSDFGRTPRFDRSLPVTGSRSQSSGLAAGLAGMMNLDRPTGWVYSEDRVAFGFVSEDNPNMTWGISGRNDDDLIVGGSTNIGGTLVRFGLTYRNIEKPDPRSYWRPGN